MHAPTIKQYVAGEHKDSWTSDCSCGWSDPFFWAGNQGAVQAYVRHVVDTEVPTDIAQRTRIEAS